MGRQKRPPGDSFTGSQSGEKKQRGAPLLRRKTAGASQASVAEAMESGGPVESSLAPGSDSASRESSVRGLDPKKDGGGLAGSGEIRVAIASDIDIVAARTKGRELATSLGFAATDLTLIATAISELARNILLHAKQGEVALAIISNGSRRGIEIAARDQGPGMLNVEQAIQEGYSTSRGLGMGLPGVRRLMDEFHITSHIGHGTAVTARKWKS